MGRLVHVIAVATLVLVEASIARAQSMSLSEWPASTMPVDTSKRVSSILFGDDGNMWFTHMDRRIIGRFAPATPSTITEFSKPGWTFPLWGPHALTNGPDRNIWFTRGGLLGRVKPDGSITEFPLRVPNAGATGLTAGSDRQPPALLGDRLWFTQSGTNSLAYLLFK